MADPKDLATQLSAFNAIEAEQPWYKKQLPMEGRATFLPFRDTMEGSVFNKREVALPGILAGALNAFTAPERARTSLDPTFNAGEEAANFALNTFGGGIATGKALRNPTGQGGVDLSMNAWHGSPHNIEGNFDLAKVGTGEGAQAYGHGIYYGGARSTGERFRDTNKQKGFNFQNEEAALGFELPPSARGQFMQLAQRYPNDPMQAAGWVQSGNIAARDIPKEKIADLFKVYNEKTQGFLYKVDIPDEQIPLMMDWNKPFNQQTPQVQAAFTKLYTDKNIADADVMKWFADIDKEKGHMSAFYNNLATSDNLKGAKDVSRLLLQEGVPGIRYLDDKSKAVGAGTSNFVVFKPETVKILEKNDVPVTRKELLQQEFDKLNK
jgi:hypothetical protein